MALTFIWGGLWIGYWIVDIGGWYVSVWTMCILSVGWTCCQPKRWLSSPCGGARAGGGRGVAAKVPDACPRPPSRVWLQPRASAAAHLSLAQPQHFTCCLVTATSASAHLTATPAHYYFRYYSDNGVIALLATVLSTLTPGISLRECN